MSESVGAGGKGLPLHAKILIGLVVGALLGVAASLWASPDFIDKSNRFVAYPIGQVFLRMLFMIVMPLVFASIALGVAGLGDVRKLGRLGGKTLAYFAVSTALAATLGLLLVRAVRPGSRVSPETRTELLARFADSASVKVQAQTQQNFGIGTFVNIVTRNPIKSAADGDMLGVIFFALMFGAALTLIAGATAKPMIDVLTALNEVVIKIVGMAMSIAPYGVAALIFGMTSQFGFELLKPLGVYVGLVLVALLLHVFVTLALILRLYVGINPFAFLGRARAALVTAFSTSSSSATLPTAVATGVNQLGFPKELAGFVFPLGSTMCMNGTALFEGITVLFLCQVFGVDLNLGQMAIVMTMSVITAIGAAGVPGGSIPLLVGILAMVGVPGEGIAIVLGVDRILDMSRTTVNVLGDFVATAVVGRSEKIWDTSMIPAKR